MDHILSLVSLIAGSSICAARELCRGFADIAINWYGGWHHAQRYCHIVLLSTGWTLGFITCKTNLHSLFRDAAEGFCYVNDIVLAIEELRSSFSRVLYIDLDVHHGCYSLNLIILTNEANCSVLSGEYFFPRQWS